MLKKFIAVVGLAKPNLAMTTLIWAVGLDMARLRIDHKNSVYLRLQKLQVTCHASKLKGTQGNNR